MELLLVVAASCASDCTCVHEVCRGSGQVDEVGKWVGQQGCRPVSAMVTMIGARDLLTCVIVRIEPQLAQVGLLAYCSTEPATGATCIHCKMIPGSNNSSMSTCPQWGLPFVATAGR
jgi:hypothetical protein